jgi:hypothetical protein
VLEGNAIAAGEPEPIKAMLRPLINEPHVNSRSETRADLRIVTPEVSATPSSWRELGVAQTKCWLLPTLFL